MAEKTQAYKDAQARYDKEKTQFFGLKLNRETDADIIAEIEKHKESRQGFIKDCIRKALDAPDHADQADRKLLQYHPMGWIDVNYGVPLFTEDGFDTLGPRPCGRGGFKPVSYGLRPSGYGRRIHSAESI